MRILIRWQSAFVLALSLAVIGAAVLVSRPARAQTMQVTIQNFSFQPTPLTVPVGATVTWVNHDGVAHTTTSDSGVWDSGAIAPGASYSHTFSAAGTFPYHCNIHPTMHGMIIVQQQATTPGTGTVSPGVTATTVPIGTGTPVGTGTAIPGNTATATAPPLAAYPVAVDRFTAKRAGAVVRFRWHLMSPDGVRGFQLYAGKHRLTAGIIPLHQSLSYRHHVRWTGKGRFSLEIIMTDGQQVRLPTQ